MARLNLFKVNDFCFFVVGHYIYMEGSLGSSGDRANLISPELLPAPEACFTFWYNMYGYNMGNLSLFTKVAFLCRLFFF